MEGESSSCDNDTEEDFSTIQDPCAMVEAVYEDENLPADNLSKTPGNLNTKLSSRSNETKIIYPHKCPLCHRGFTKLGPLKSHCAKAHGDAASVMFLVDDTLSCKICKKTFNHHPSQLAKHMSRYHPVNDDKPTAVRLWHCGICDEKFSEKPALEAHYTEHAEEETVTCDKCSDKQRCDCDNRAFICRACKEGFDTKTDLQSHFSIHTKEEFLCNVCKAGFNMEQNLKRHKTYFQHF